MIKFLENYTQILDSRGFMKGLINQGNWKELNFFFTKSGQIRGNHYHKITDELFIILKGKMEIELTSVNPKCKNNNNSKKVIVKNGDVFIIKKNTRHIFHILEDTEWINGLSKKMDKKNPDIYT